ncbi:MAG TPA: DUF373 family protein [Candidatus Norongarragalinales archaeon]|nr:DUF373 family protein [Candidatus Norongarragalinales archaeon]
MSEAKRLLVLCVDVDNDLGAKAKVKGPIVGRAENIKAANALGIADPEDSDVNTIYAAVKLYDELGKEAKSVFIATLSGDARGGYHAHSEIVRQLEKIIDSLAPDACVFVSDGASDEQMIPLINSRIKVNSVRTVTVKQTKQLESTYFAILEKIKDPQIARIVFGIPALVLLFFALSDFFGSKFIMGIIGVYLLVFKALGVEDKILALASEIRVSFENVSFIFYFASVPFFIASLWMAFNRVFTLQYSGATLSTAKVIAWFAKDLLLLLPVAVLLIIVGEVLQALSEKKNHMLPEYLIQTAGVLVFWLIFTNTADWVIGTLSFENFFYSLLLGVAAMYLVSYLAREFKHDLFSKMHLEGKGVYTELGSHVGVIVGINKRNETFIVKTSSGQKIDLSMRNIASLGEKIVVKY